MAGATSAIAMRGTITTRSSSRRR